jgi:hypothetical protein
LSFLEERGGGGMCAPVLGWGEPGIMKNHCDNSQRGREEFSTGQGDDWERHRTAQPHPVMCQRLTSTSPILKSY